MAGKPVVVMFCVGMFILVVTERSVPGPAANCLVGCLSKCLVIVQDIDGISHILFRMVNLAWGPCTMSGMVFGTRAV